MPTAAILLATVAGVDRTPAATLPCGDTTLLGRLLEQLATLDVEGGWIITRPQWESEIKAVVAASPLQLEVRTCPDVSHDLTAVAEVAAQASGRLVLASADLLTHREALAGLLADPRVASGILTTTSKKRGSWTMRTRAERGRVVSAGSPYHKVRKPTGYFLSVIKVDHSDVDALVEATSALAGLTSGPVPERWAETFERKQRRWRRRLVRKQLNSEESPTSEEMSEVIDSDAPEPRIGVSELAESDARVPAVSELTATESAVTQAPAAETVDSASLAEAEEATAPVLTDDAVDNFPLDEEAERTIALRTALYTEDALPLVLVGLVRNRVHLTNSYLRQLYWTRPLSEERAVEATEKLAGYDEDKVLLDSAVKGSDGFFTTYFVSPYSRYIARWCARLGLTPNIVTSISMLMGIVAAVAFATGSRTGLIAGAVLLQLAFTLDCVDGQLARYTRQFSKLGAWLDSVFDRGKEYVVFAGLAIGATAGFGDNVWLLAAAALGLQTVRHSVDFAYAASRHNVIAKLPTVPLDQPEDRKVSVADADNVDIAEDDDEEVEAEPVQAPEPEQKKLPLGARAGRAAIRVSRAFERQPWMRWAKKIIVLPIGERFALISITAAIWDPRVTFMSLLVWGSFALTYQLAGKVLRTVAS